MKSSISSSVFAFYEIVASYLAARLALPLCMSLHHSSRVRMGLASPGTGKETLNGRLQPGVILPHTPHLSITAVLYQMDNHSVLSRNLRHEADN